MKNNLSLLCNPFVKIAGWKAFFIGFVILSISIYLGSLSGVWFPGALDVKFTSEVSLKNAFIYQFVGCASIAVVFYMFALIFAKGTRFQDILGTTVLAHFPYLFIALLGFLLSPDVSRDLENAAIKFDTIQIIEILKNNVGLIIVSLSTIPFVIWFLILLYNAFSVSTGMKGGKAVGTFVGAIIIAEIVSIILFIITTKVVHAF